ncbi:TSUP family transporter [Alkaliphilus crotonatoxidans]
MILILLGLVTGFIGGMGIGGGTILIPGLILLTQLPQQTIQSVNLISFIPVAIVALIIHFKNKNIVLKLSIPLILFGLLGAWLGANIALKISSETLRKLFGIFLFGMGIYEIFYKGKENKNQ